MVPLCLTSEELYKLCLTRNLNLIEETFVSVKEMFCCAEGIFETSDYHGEV